MSPSMCYPGYSPLLIRPNRKKDRLRRKIFFRCPRNTRDKRVSRNDREKIANAAITLAVVVHPERRHSMMPWKQMGEDALWADDRIQEGIVHREHKHRARCRRQRRTRRTLTGHFVTFIILAFGKHLFILLLHRTLTDILRREVMA